MFDEKSDVDSFLFFVFSKRRHHQCRLSNRRPKSKLCCPKVLKASTLNPNAPCSSVERGCCGRGPSVTLLTHADLHREGTLSLISLSSKERRHPSSVASEHAVEKATTTTELAGGEEGEKSLRIRPTEQAKREGTCGLFFHHHLMDRKAQPRGVSHGSCLLSSSPWCSPRCRMLRWPPRR